MARYVAGNSELLGTTLRPLRTVVLLVPDLATPVARYVTHSVVIVGHRRWRHRLSSLRLGKYDWLAGNKCEVATCERLGLCDGGLVGGCVGPGVEVGMDEHAVIIAARLAIRLVSARLVEPGIPCDGSWGAGVVVIAVHGCTAHLGVSHLLRDVMTESAFVTKFAHSSLRKLPAHLRVVRCWLAD
jgi:hypothetical protein